MCGRYRLNNLGDINPGDWAPVWVLGTSKWEKRQWGVDLKRDTDKHFKLINTRAESLLTKPWFKTAWQQHRLMVPADGYYEWREENKLKVPYFFQRKDGERLYFFGLGFEPQKFAIITVEASPWASQYHHRMPAIATDLKSTETEIHRLLIPRGDEMITAWKQ